MNASLFSVGQIAARLGEPIHRIEYVIRSRSIQPAGRIGNARAFTNGDVDRVAGELRRIREEREVARG